jgi:flagellar biosynthesis chaperone FliJ
MTNIPSSNVSFSPLQGSVADYVLNHPTASPFKKHNISFHIGGNYLNDFSDKGIKQFVKQHDSKLSFQEVGTFIQTAAANAPKLAGATFNLADPELGLGKKDDIKQEHIRTGFTLETKSGTLPAKDVVFFDATKASFPLQDAEKAVKEAEQKVKGLERELNKAQGNVEDAQYLRQRLVDFLGKDSPKDLAEKQSVVQSMESKITELKTDRGNYETYLKQLEEEHNSQTPNPPSGLDQNTRWQRIGQMKHAIRGLDLEIKDSEKALSDAKKSISAKQGPLSFMGVGNSLSELHERNQNLNKAQTQLGQVRTQLDAARTTLKDAQDLRARILRGESITQPQQPAQPPQAPVEPPKPEAPAKPPVAQEPIAPTR